MRARLGVRTGDGCTLKPSRRPDARRFTWNILWVRRSGSSELADRTDLVRPAPVGPGDVRRRGNRKILFHVKHRRANEGGGRGRGRARFRPTGCTGRAASAPSPILETRRAHAELRWHTPNTTGQTGNSMATIEKRWPDTPGLRGSTLQLSPDRILPGDNVPQIRSQLPKRRVRTATGHGDDAISRPSLRVVHARGLPQTAAQPVPVHRPPRYLLARDETPA